MSAPEDTLVMELPAGQVTIALRPDLAPEHVARVKELVRFCEVCGNVSEAARCRICTDPRRDGEPGWFRVDITPRRSLHKLRTMPKDLVYVVDTSSSVPQDWIREVILGVQQSLRLLNEGDRFNIVLFSDNPAFFSTKGTVPASVPNIEAGLAFLTSAQSDGWTDVNAALSHVLTRDVQADRVYEVILITDGLPDPMQPGRALLSVDGPGGSVRLSSSGVSGELGGILEFRERVLDPARAELGRLATAFATAFNDAHRAGVDYTGAAGTDFFSLPPPRVDAHTGNTGSATISPRVDSLAALKGQDLVLRFDGAWSATRADTGESVPMTGSGTAADPFRVDGLAFEVGGTPAPGDRFALRPGADAASGLRVALTDPGRIAAAAPLQAGADPGNLGNARAASAQVTDPAAFASFAGATVEFIDAGQYTIDGNGPYAWTPGSPIADAAAGWRLSLEGAPAAGDRFTLSPTPPRSTDNGNALALGALDQRELLDGGTQSLTAGLAQLTARAGTEARHASLSHEAQGAIHAQVVAERESVSGVNLEEEAANLLRYQQAYQAAAQIIATADTMFQTLLSAVRR